MLYYTLNPENLSLQQYLSYVESLELHPEASNSGMRPKTSVLSIFPQSTTSHAKTISKLQIRNLKHKN